MYRYATENCKEKNPQKKPQPPDWAALRRWIFLKLKKAQLITWVQHEALEKWKTTEIIEVLVQI